MKVKYILPLLITICALVQSAPWATVAEIQENPIAFDHKSVRLMGNCYGFAPITLSSVEFTLFDRTGAIQVRVNDLCNGEIKQGIASIEGTVRIDNSEPYVQCYNFTSF